jgi:hypothetical protein
VALYCQMAEVFSTDLQTTWNDKSFILYWIALPIYITYYKLNYIVYSTRNIETGGVEGVLTFRDVTIDVYLGYVHVFLHNFVNTLYM